jgi:hypothetical protein
MEGALQGGELGSAGNGVRLRAGAERDRPHGAVVSRACEPERLLQHPHRGGRPGVHAMVEHAEIDALSSPRRYGAARSQRTASAQATSSSGSNGRSVTNSATCAGPHASWNRPCVIADSARCPEAEATSTSTRASAAIATRYASSATAARSLERSSDAAVLAVRPKRFQRLSACAESHEAAVKAMHAHTRSDHPELLDKVSQEDLLNWIEAV